MMRQDTIDREEAFKKAALGEPVSAGDLTDGKVIEVAFSPKRIIVALMNGEQYIESGDFVLYFEGEIERGSYEIEHRLESMTTRSPVDMIPEDFED